MRGKTITEPAAQRDLLHQMVEVRKAEAIGEVGMLERFLIGTPVVWTEAFLEKPISLDLADKWVSLHGEWDHGYGYQRTQHNRLGMAFAMWAVEGDRLKDLRLRDCPDFVGSCSGNRVFGDIGACSPNTMRKALFGSRAGSLWISVLSASHQVILEYDFDIGMAISEALSGSLFSHEITVSE